MKNILGSISRRSFLQLSLLASSVGGLTLSPLKVAVAQAIKDMDPYVWNACVINCGQRCAQRCFVRNGKIIRVETDNIQPDGCDSYQIRACVRGRALRQRVYSPDRLKFPMKRVGERGEGKFERISWDEAIKTVAAALKNTIEKYGNESLYWQYCSGQQSMVNGRVAWWRLLNMLGGYLKYYGSYSTAQISAAMPYTYGGRPGSQMSEIANAKLYVTFGGNNSVTKGGGASKGFLLECAMQKEKPKMIMIDPMYNDTCVGKADQWIPIRVGTDAALVEAVAYELIRNNWVDQEFLDKYCVGYDEKTLPASAPKNSDYKSYILGNGPDKTPKTPERASKITGIPVSVIVGLAKDMGTMKPCFVSQGWGPQRQANGEQTCRAIAMLPILLGQVGLPGTNPGDAEGNASFKYQYLPVGKNPVKAAIPVFMWTDAIVRGEQMTDLTDGMRGVKKLGHNIKMIVNSGGNTTINQHSDTNATDKILRDTSKCEFIVVCDNVMTPTCRYADILLPDVMGPETNDMACQGSHFNVAVLLAMHKAVEPQWEQKSTYEICRLLAKELGIEEKFTEGRTQEDWIKWCYEATRKNIPELPEFEVFWKGGPTALYSLKKNPVGLSAFRADPEKNPLKTPSGKIEIYSERLAKIAETWKLPEGDVITPLPQYVSTWDMPDDPKSKQFPLQCYGFHHHGRIHSTFHNLPWLREQHPDVVFINTHDAAARGIKNGDLVQVFNDRGIVELPAKVTSRIIPGVVTIPQGAWYKPVESNGKVIDKGGCINTLTSLRPSPLAKGNPQHTNLVEVRLA